MLKFEADGLEAWCLHCQTEVVRNCFSPAVRHLIVRSGALSALEGWCRCLCEAVSLFLTYSDRTELCQSVLHIPTFTKALGAECYCLSSFAVHSGI